MMILRIITAVVLTTSLMACSSSSKTEETVAQSENATRTVASRGSLQGTYLGVASIQKSQRKPAMRLYLNEIPGEPGSYHAVLLEYVNLLGILPKYVASNRLEKVSEIIGFLNKIVKNITVYKVVPADKAFHYDMLELRANTREIKAVRTTKTRQLILNSKRDLKHPLEGAAITEGRFQKARKISFPMENSRENHGGEYGAAKLVYDNIGLDSTWRKKFLPGEYLAAYGKKNDPVLVLQRAGSKMRAYFQIDEEFAYASMSKTERQRRQNVFTNPRSAYLEGGFVMREPVDGMFTMSPMHSNESKYSVDEMNGRIALFIDIFDATKKLNQDVVEIVFINPADPTDFHMHYEHPDNGEGT